MAWLLVVVAGILETGFAVCLKLSHGFTRLWPTIAFAVFALGSFGLLTLALQKLDVGPAYAVWTGIGAAGTAIYGMVFLDDVVSSLKLVSISLVIVGVIGLQLSRRLRALTVVRAFASAARATDLLAPAEAADRPYRRDRHRLPHQPRPRPPSRRPPAPPRTTGRAAPRSRRRVPAPPPPACPSGSARARDRAVPDQRDQLRRRRSGPVRAPLGRHRGDRGHGGHGSARAAARSSSR